MLHNSYYHNNLIHISNLFFFPFKFSFSYQTLSGPRKKKQKVPKHLLQKTPLIPIPLSKYL